LEAVAAYRDALVENTRERVPLDWASDQNSICFALGKLGKRESGAKLLEEALTACHQALEEFTREQAPVAWAITQNTLCFVLRQLGERESGCRRKSQVRP
jgi:hypothetical protein